MKKRLFVLLFALLLLIPCLATGASAVPLPEEPRLSLDERLQTLRYNDTSYVRFDARYTPWEEYGQRYYNVDCTATDVIYAEASISTEELFITVYLYYEDGSQTTLYFIQKTRKSEHSSLSKPASEAIVDFQYPSKNTVPFVTGYFRNDPVQLSISYGDDYDLFEVYSQSKDGRIRVDKGLLLIHEEQYYYIDYEAAGFLFPVSDLTVAELNRLPAFAIHDPAVTLRLEEAYDRYNSYSFGLFSGSFMDVVGTVLLVLAFCIFPLAVFVVFLILALQAKTRVYKKLFTVIYIVAAAALAMFALITVLLIVLL